MLNNSLVQNGDVEVAEGVTEVAEKFIASLVNHDSDGVIDTTDIPLLYLYSVAPRKGCVS